MEERKAKTGRKGSLENVKGEDKAEEKTKWGRESEKEKL